MRTRFVWFVLSVLVLAACGQQGPDGASDSEPESQPTFDAVPDLIKERAREITFTAHTSWSLEAEDDWLSATPSSGGPGRATVQLQADAGKLSGASASTTLTLHHGQARQSVSVTVVLPDASLPDDAPLEIAGFVGETVVTSVAIANKGRAPLRIVRVSAEASWLDAVPPSSGDIAAGGTGRITVVASCGDAPTTSQGAVVVEHDDPDAGTTSIAVNLTCSSQPEEPEEPVDETPPQVSIAAPADGTTVAELPVMVMGSASDDVGVEAVDVRIDEGPMEVCDLQSEVGGVSFACAVDGLAVGGHQLRVVAWDAAGHSAEASIAVTYEPAPEEPEEPVDDVSPAVSITEPEDGATVAELPVAVSGTATDDVGVEAVDVGVDGGALEACDLQATDGGVSFACAVDGLALGDHQLRVVAWDAAGNSAEDAIALTYEPVPEEPEDTSFDIELVYYGTPSPTGSQRALFESAARRWASVISSDLPDEDVNKSADTCTAGEPQYSGEIDDVLIFASISKIDGRGGTQAMAGPCRTRSDGMPLYGIMIFDIDDLAALEANAGLESVILHEMGHVLGIGTLWRGLLEPRPCPGAGAPYYVGQHGVAEWHGYGGSGDVPVEGDYGSGTACGHWDEWEFQNELMTGFLDATMPLSRITIGSLEDLGFDVDYSAADGYVLPTAALRRQAEPGFQIQERLITPLR